jgi:hypothetical protein
LIDLTVYKKGITPATAAGMRGAISDLIAKHGKVEKLQPGESDPRD